MISRRDFLKFSAACGASAYFVHLAKWGSLAQSIPQTPLPGSSIPQFVNPLPELEAVIPGTNTLELRMAEFQTQVLPTGFVLPGGAPYTGTWVWGYLQAGQTSRQSYIGPVVVSLRGIPTTVHWKNDLGHTNSTNVIAYTQSSDQTLHWADPLGDEENMYAHTAGMPMYGEPRSMNYNGPIPAVPHLHGGEIPPVLDGGPNAWFTSDGSHHGHGYHTYSQMDAEENEAIYRYPNTQEAAPIWFHDHTLGATRLAVYAGMAGAYLLLDPNLNLPANLPGPGEIIPLVLQDRTFDTNGQFFLQAGSNGGVLWSPNPDHPYWVPEFVGDTIIINGKAWPHKAIERKRYRFLFVNGSNARTYEMFLMDPGTKVKGPPIWVIGTDGGFLDTPVKIDPNAPKGSQQRLVMMPGERYEAIIDFNDPTWLALNPNFSGSLVLKNVAKTPYPAGGTPQGSTVGQMMKFIVGAAPAAGDPSYNPAAGIPLRQGSQSIIRLVNPAAGSLAAGVSIAKTRQLTLNEVMGMPQNAEDPTTGVMTAYPGGPLEILVNNTKWDGQRITGVETMENGMQMYTREPIPGFVEDSFLGNYLSEMPQEGDTEMWEIVNLTADAHPIHLHLVQFQLMNRQAFNTNKYPGAYAAAFPGGGYDSMTGAAYPAKTHIPAWGPPLAYDKDANPRSGGKYGGNPNIDPYLKGPVMPPLPSEAGWKDTVIMYPGQVTRIIVRWAPTDIPVNAPAEQLHYPFDPAAGDAGYVWHCHIIDHEDNEMMRPDKIIPKGDAPRSFIMGDDY